MDVSDQITINQTDHVLLKANKKEVIQNIRSRRGPNMESEHFLQKVIIKQKLLTIYRKKLDNSKNGIKQIYKAQ
jgi:hypothetical protein